MQRRKFIATSVSGFVGLSGCLGGEESNPDILGSTLTVTTGTTVYDTGLMGEFNDAFESRFGAGVETVAQGTGAALRTGRNGDADVVLVHARHLEDEFIAKGYGVNRRDLMFNDFVVVGPPEDPAGIHGIEDVDVAFIAIAETESVFFSRGDSSGTHAKEVEIWASAGIEPDGDWYRPAGSGMGEALNQANLLGDAYTLTDRATFLLMRTDIELEIHVQGPIEGGPASLANPYGIVAVNPAVHGHVEYDIAMAYIGFLTSSAGQAIIEEFTVDAEQLYFPTAVTGDPNFEQYVPEGWRPSGGGDDG